MTASTAFFRKAVPIWPTGRQTEMNLTVGFRGRFSYSAGHALLRLTASTDYRAFVNGRYVGYGPARAPKGFFRIDEWNIDDHVTAGENIVAIEVAGYNVNSYCGLDQPSFLQAEVECCGEVALATSVDGSNGFGGAVLSERIQKVQRYSFQRCFSEAYRLRPGFDAWRCDAAAAFGATQCERSASGSLLARGVPYPSFALRQPISNVASGKVRKAQKQGDLWRDWSLTEVGRKLKGYAEAELDAFPSMELQHLKRVSLRRANRPFDPVATVRLAAGSFQILDFGTNLTGFVGVNVTCAVDSRFFLVFDEILTEDDVDFTRMGCVNIIELRLAAGSYDVEAMEPYTMRYLKLLCLEGECRVDAPYLREYASPDVWSASFLASDLAVNRIFDAARETYRQNAADIFMDCPSRERAGWLCDSFFTARTAFSLTGSTAAERMFLENYLLPERFENMPEGMWPMCYPGDQTDGTFIPNWALWGVLQLEEYLGRSNDRAMIDAFRPKVMALLKYFTALRNSDGLLEGLKSWVFVEWSKANEFVQDVNYPSNMLFASALAAAGRMYGDKGLLDDAAGVRKAILKQSFDGSFFVDNALRKDGNLEITRNRTEVCQYYAFFFDLVTPTSHPKLWRTMVTQLGPRRKPKALPEIHPANALPGNYLRFDILSRYGEHKRMLAEAVDFFEPMARLTGTLWENNHSRASCNHGFASHAAHGFVRDVLGVKRIDPVGKVVTLHFADVGLPWCQGRVPLGSGFVDVAWERKGRKVSHRVSVPKGYRVVVGK